MHCTPVAAAAPAHRTNAHIWRRQVQQTDLATALWRPLFYAITRNDVLNYYRKIMVDWYLNYAVRQGDALSRGGFSGSFQERFCDKLILGTYIQVHENTFWDGILQELIALP